MEDPFMKVSLSTARPRALMVALCGLLPLAAHAQDLRPTYNEVSYIAGRDKSDLRTNALYARMEVSDRIQVHGAVYKHRASSTSHKIGEYALGVGYRHPIADNLDFHATVFGSHVRDRWNLDSGDIRATRTGYVVKAGVKYRPTEAFQIAPTVGYSSVGSSRYLQAYRTPFIETEMSYDFSRHWGVTGAVSLHKGGNWGVLAGPRFTW
ncbi:hypothetical protein [Luteimonas sp. e5]